MNENNTWPQDVDGDVLRLLQGRGFDFNLEHEIEFMIDFKFWPLSKEQQAEVLKKLPEVSFVETEVELLEEGDPTGYASFKVKNKVTYDFVTQEPQRLSNLFVNMNGYCDSWVVVSGCGS